MKLPLKTWLLLGSFVAGVLLSTAHLRGEISMPNEPASELSASSAEVVRLVQAGVEEQVILGYVTNSTNRFELSADDHIYLR
ncbi:MAG: hypothetical protein ACK4UN_09630, partial [Limisphaerales bacterium]